MFRYLLLLVLCLPLLWKAYRETEALAWSCLAGGGPSDEALAGLGDRLKAAGDGVAGKYGFHESILRCVDGVGEDCPGVPSPSQAETELTPKLKDYASKLKDVHMFFTRWGDKAPDPDWRNPCENRDLKKLLDYRQDFLKLRAEAEQLFGKWQQASPEEKQELKKELDQKIAKLKNHPGGSPGSDRKLLADIAQRELKRKLAALPEAVAKADLDKRADRAKLLGRLDTAVQQCDEYLQQFGDMPDLAALAEKEKATWKRYKTLLELIDQNEDHQSGNEFLNHLGKYDDLIKQSGISSDLVKMIRRSAVSFCGSFLPVEKLDTKVLLSDKEDPYERRLVQVHWKKGPASPLEDPDRPDQNEFTLEKMDVEYFSVGTKDIPWPIHPTERSKTARKFNELRGKLNWTEVSLIRLRDDYKKMRATDPVTLNRLNTLVDAAGKYRKLFAAGG